MEDIVSIEPGSQKLGGASPAIAPVFLVGER